MTKNPFLLFAFVGLFVASCSEKEDNDKIAPKLVTTTPSNGALNISESSAITLLFDEPVALSTSQDITVNGNVCEATVTEKSVTLQLTLETAKQYKVLVPQGAVTDLSGNQAEKVEFSFCTNGLWILEAENATYNAGLTVATDMSGYSGSGYLYNFANSTDNVSFTVSNMSAGRYDLYVGYNTSNWGTKFCNVAVNGTASSVELTATNSAFSKALAGTVKLSSGTNTIVVSPNYTWFCIDYIELVPNTTPLTPFNVSAALVTPSPSSQATKVYNYLKDKFGKYIITGAMAAHSTNIAEAQWVYDNTGKYPALTCFDFIDHTAPTQDWVQYTAPFTLGSDWWSNNGLVALMWHWRDPLNKKGAFYSANTTFDITKVSDPNSNEYKAMIEDIDVIAGYLKSFKDANIPVIWRPLHEAAGGWFWWGAKGPQPCVALWRLMFDRLVNYHGLNNLIWVWTTDVSSTALDWYPGDEYVDVIGMDIYPGENQHGSQYLAFDKARELFQGKKILTLSECGSAPDPAQMTAFGDTWSWFMPWNGDYTRDDKHNGATWWKKYVGYSYVITRDKMPSLK